jgi:hypothetical protein
MADKIGSQTNNLKFFREMRRNHRSPYYRIPGIHLPLASMPLGALLPPSPQNLPAPDEEVQDVRDKFDTERVNASNCQH